MIDALRRQAARFFHWLGDLVQPETGGGKGEEQ